MNKVKAERETDRQTDRDRERESEKNSTYVLYSKMVETDYSWKFETSPRMGETNEQTEIYSKIRSVIKKKYRDWNFNLFNFII